MPANNPDTVDASKSANFTLSDSLLTTTDGMSMNLSGITNADLVATTNRTFTVSGWTGSGALTSPESGGAAGTAQTGTITAVTDGGFELSDTSLSSTDGMRLRSTVSLRPI